MIFDGDNRIWIQNTTSNKYNKVVAVYILKNGQFIWNGSGVLIAPNKVLTAAHVIRHHVSNKTYDKVLVVPAQSGNSKPYGGIEGSAYYFLKNYLNDLSTYYSQNKMQEDIAVISLKSSFSIGGAQVSNALSIDQSIEVVGYPWDKDLNMYMSPGKVRLLDNNGKTVKYRNDTLPGNSGGPIFDTQNRVVAINVAEPKSDIPNIQENGSNTGRRMNSEALNLVNSGLQNRIIGSETLDSYPTYRLYHSVQKYHLYTNDENESNVQSQKGWKYEGVAWRSASTGTPVFRLYHSGIKKHILTKDIKKRDTLVQRGWKYEKILFHSSGNQSVYRLYHSELKVHLYTTDENEYKVLATRGWRQEGLAWKVQ